MPPAGAASAVAAADSYTCALTLAGQAYCWGNGSSGFLGTGNTTNQTVPTPEKVVAMARTLCNKK